MIAALLDLVLVVIFTLIGRASHDEALSFGGLVETAWPFVIALAVGWLSARAWRSPARLWPTGVIVWASTVVVGMLLRAAFGHGTATAFIIVTCVTLAAFLLGWRGIVAVVARTRARATARSS